MATVNILQPAFGIKWAQDGTVEAIDEAQWRAGWSFIGATPPSVEQFNKVHQVQDEKSNWLYQQMLSIFTAGGETPTVGDLNSLRDATRAVIRGMLGNYAGQTNYPGPVTLTAADIGKITVVAGNVVMPLASAGVPGDRIKVVANLAARTVSPQGGNVLLRQDGVPVASMTVLTQGYLILERNLAGDGWNATEGDASFQFSPYFASTIGATGSLRNPSGAIEKWGIFTSSASADVPVSFTNAFPTACRNVVLCASNSVGAFATATGLTSAGFNGAAWTSTSSRVANNVYWRAIGD